MKNVIDIISNICPITGDALIDSLIFFIIGIICFLIAWFLTGTIAEMLDFYNSSVMSFFHWFIRIVVFAFLLAITIGIVNFVHWISSWPLWAYILLICVVICAIVGFAIVVSHKSKNHIKKDNKNEK